MRLAWLVIALAACSSPGSVVDVTMTFDSTVSNAALAGVTALVLHASGDESGTYPISPGRALLRTERLVYRYASTTHSLGLDVDAKDASGAVIASGSAGPIAVSSTHALTITLSAPSIADLGNVDQATFDSMTSDLPTPSLDMPMVPSDLSTPYAYPAFVSGTYASDGSGSNAAITVSRPPGVSSGVLLLATIAGVASGSSAVMFSTPTGWNLLTTVSDTTTTPVAVTWFWRYATSAEPMSYTFTRADDGPIAAYVAAYVGTVDQMNGFGPFDSPMTKSSGNSVGNATFPTTSIHAHDELVVVNVFARDGNFVQTWNISMTYGQRDNGAVSSGDVVSASYGVPVGGGTASPSQSTRWMSFVVGLRGIGQP